MPERSRPNVETTLPIRGQAIDRPRKALNDIRSASVKIDLIKPAEGGRKDTSCGCDGYISPIQTEIGQSNCAACVNVGAINPAGVVNEKQCQDEVSTNEKGMCVRLLPRHTSRLVDRVSLGNGSFRNPLQTAAPQMVAAYRQELPPQHPLSGKTKRGAL